MAGIVSWNFRLERESLTILWMVRMANMGRNPTQPVQLSTIPRAID
jgi:hypothetical protein